MEQDKMRDEFEAWHREKYPEQDVRKQNLLGTYTFIIVEQRWECWQASRAAVVVELPYAGTLLAPQWNEAIDRCRAAIHAAGIRTR